MSKALLGYDKESLPLRDIGSLRGSAEATAGGQVHLAYDVPVTEAEAVYREAARARGRAWLAAYNAKHNPVTANDSDPKGNPVAEVSLTDQDLRAVAEARLVNHPDYKLMRDLVQFLKDKLSDDDMNSVMTMIGNSPDPAEGSSAAMLGMLDEMGAADPETSSVAMDAKLRTAPRISRRRAAVRLAMDSTGRASTGRAAVEASFAERFPHAAKIGLDQYPGFNR